MLIIFSHANPKLSSNYVFVQYKQIWQCTAAYMQNRKNKYFHSKKKNKKTWPMLTLWGLTDDVAAVVGDQGLAVNIDELCDQWLVELGMSPRAAERDVLAPLVLH